MTADNPEQSIWNQSMTELSLDTGRDRHGYVLGFLSLVLTVLVLTLDMTMPKSLTDDVLIVLPMLVGLWMPWRYSAFVLATMATTATAVDIALDPDSVLLATLANHGIAVFVIWIAAILIFQRNTKETALRESEARFRIISELSPAALFINRLSDAVILYHNDAGAGLFGVPNEELVGRSSLDFYKDPADREALLELLAKDEEVRNHELEIRKADGTLTWALVSVRQTEFRGERVLLSVATDIAGRKGMEQALREARDELETRVAERTAELEMMNEQLRAEVAQRKVAEEALRESEERLHAFIDNSPTAISLKDMDGRYVLANPEHEKLVGKTVEEIKGKISHDLFPTEFADIAVAHDNTVLKTGAAVAWDTTVSAEDGDRTLIVTKFPVRDVVGRIVAIGSISTDITERKRAEEALREGEERLRRAQEIARIGDFVWDEREDRLIIRSPVIDEIYGIEGDAVPKEIGDLLEFIHADDRDRVRGVFSAATGAGEPYDVEYRIVRADGGVRYVHKVSAPIFDENGAHVRSLGTMQDITERKQLERQLLQSSKLATLGEMAAGMAHELNQPLHIIRMAADGCLILMEEGEANVDSLREQFEIISGQTRRMAEIIDHMHVFARIDESEAIPFDPVASVKRAVDMFAEQFRIEDIDVSLSLPGACRPVLGRPVRLEQVMLNLLGNARDAIVSSWHRKGEQAGGKGRIEASLVDDRPARRVLIAISDTGGGIAADILDRLFEPFFTTKEVGDGIGLGLSITYGIVSEMGGTIEAGNVGNGTRFEIVLPVCAD